MEKETIIIGAGMAGLACAKKLKSAGKDFLIITENVGGKIQMSDDNRVNLGACLIMNNYKNVLPLIKKSRRIRLTEFSLHDGLLKPYGLAKIILYPLQILRFIPKLLKFRAAYERFKKETEAKGQKKALESSSYLTDLYKTTAQNFARKNGIFELTEKILSQPLYACTGLPLSDNSAFDLLRLSLGLITPTYEFSFAKEEIISVFSDRLIFDTVIKITQGDPHTLYTKSGRQYQAKNIVVATPPQIAQKLLNISNLKKPNDIFSFYLEGTTKNSWGDKRYQTFDSTSEMVVLDNISNAKHVLYSKNENPNFSVIFENYKVLERRSWKPAFHLMGPVLLDCQQAKDLYLTGDHNVAGLEDAYITGLFAANEIINQ
jgi:hypothetical protein